jgi:hypothetical protein
MQQTVSAGDSSSKRVTPSNGGNTNLELACEKHYTPLQIAELWAVSTDTVLRTFREEPGVIQFGSAESRFGRKRKTLRIPESILIRVHQKLHQKLQ